MSDLCDLSLDRLLSARENARDALAVAQKAAARGISARLDAAVTILRECSRALHAIDCDTDTDILDELDELDDAIETIRALSSELSGKESEVP